MNPESQQQDVREIILESQKLLIENNALLKKMHKSAVRHFWFNIAWIVVFLGLPLIAFYKLAMPLYESFGTSPNNLSDQLKDVKELQNFLDNQR